MKYKMIIFDLDGTILNTIADLCTACNYALQQFNLDLITIEDTKKYLGHGIKQLIFEAAKFDKRSEDILSVFKRYYSEHYNDFTTPYTTINQVLEYCKQKNCKIGVYTNKVEEIAIPLVQAHFTQFDFIYGDKESRPRKPDPTFLNRLIESYHFNVEDVLYIGDSEVDYALAINAGVDVVCVSYGFRARQDLEKLTSHIADTPEEIIQYLE